MTLSQLLAALGFGTLTAFGLLVLALVIALVIGPSEDT